MSDYKISKEAFVSGTTGSSVRNINLLSSVAVASIALHSTLRTRFPPNKTLHFPAEVFILVLPILLSVTIFAEFPTLLVAALLVLTGVLLLAPPQESGIPLPSSLSPSREPSPSRDSHEPHGSSGSGVRDSSAAVPPLAALTTYRAHMLLLTFICILAVDFPLFPRTLAKCETFGLSLMDMGVGSFVFSQGVVSAIPIIRNPSYLRASFFRKLSIVLRKILPLLLLGFFRTISVKGTEYPEHLTEYGEHWNFFITLALIPVLQVVLHPLMIHLPVSILGMVVALSHQMTLSAGGLMNYILHAPRVTVVSANKEGIISLTGYLAIHLLGLSTGTLLLPPSPSYFRRLQMQLKLSTPEGPRMHVSDPVYNSSDDSDNDTPGHRKSARILQYRRENDKSATELFSYAAVWWTLFGVVYWMNISGGVSRRMVNLPYILWVAAYNTTFILAYLLLDLFFFPSPLSKTVYSPYSKLKIQPDPAMVRADRRTKRAPDGVVPPALLSAINKNGLAIFLLANVVTGLINLTMPTMYMSNTSAMAILCTYCTGISMVAWLCKDIKLWRF